MSRSAGSLCSAEAKDYAKELTQLTNIPYKQNLDYIRFLEQLISFRVCEQVREFDKRNTDSVDKATCVVEIPLIGTLTIKPIIFHKQHRLTNTPSLHFNFTFEPLSGFKKHIVEAYTKGECEIPTEFSAMYGQTLNDIYKECD